MPKTATAIAAPDADEDYLRWRESVSKKCNRRWGLQLADLPDLDTHAAYSAGLTATEFFDEEVVAVMRDELGGLAELEEED
ncbi:MAG: hypothetical protein JWO36_5736 [Myxococcales bacterium]|nr:hypothetical protein [Myxococcales bacterium]